MGHWCEDITSSGSVHCYSHDRFRSKYISGTEKNHLIADRSCMSSSNLLYRSCESLNSIKLTATPPKYLQKAMNSQSVIQLCRHLNIFRDVYFPHFQSNFSGQIRSHIFLLCLLSPLV